MIQAIAISFRASLTGVLEGGNEMPVCWGWGKTPSEEEENYLLELFPFIPIFLQCRSFLLCKVFHIATALRLITLWITVCMLIIMYWSFFLWTKTLPLSIFSLENSILFPLCLLVPSPKHPLVLQGVVADLQCGLCGLFSLLARKCNPCLSLLAKVDLWKTGGGRACGRGSLYRPVLSWDSIWQSWECFDYYLKFLEA